MNIKSTLQIVVEGIIHIALAFKALQGDFAT
jgi:hypothetical protein